MRESETKNREPALVRGMDEKVENGKAEFFYGH